MVSVESVPTQAGRTFFLPLILLPSFKTGQHSPPAPGFGPSSAAVGFSARASTSSSALAWRRPRRAGRGEGPAHSSSDPVPSPALTSAKRLCVCVPVLEIEAPGWATWPRPLGKGGSVETQDQDISPQPQLWCDPHCSSKAFQIFQVKDSALAALLPRLHSLLAPAHPRVCASQPCLSLCKAFLFPPFTVS